MDQRFPITTTLTDRPSARSAAERIYEALRERILRLELRPDAMLNRNELAEYYGVSLTPVREALQFLEQDGLVRIRPQSGTVVTRIDQAQLETTQFLRVAAETEVVLRLAQNPPQPHLKRARAILDMQETLVGNPDQMDLFSGLDRTFHRTLFEGAGVEDVYHMVVRRLGHLTRCQRLELPWTGKMESIVSAHRQILAGISDRDPDVAVSAMREHLSGTISRVEGLRRAHPEYFS